MAHARTVAKNEVDKSKYIGVPKVLKNKQTNKTNIDGSMLTELGLLFIAGKIEATK